MTTRTDTGQLLAWLRASPEPDAGLVSVIPAGDVPAFALLPQRRYGFPGAFALLLEPDALLSTHAAGWATRLAAMDYCVSVNRGWEACARSIAGYLGWGTVARTTAREAA